MDTMANISSTALYTAFVLYLIATIFFGATVKQKKKETNKSISGTIGITLTILGFLIQIVYFVTRWIASEHAPVSNLFEFMTFFGMSLVFAFIVIYFIYKLNILGLFALPITMIIIAYASVFPTEISPLSASLRSDWLYIHVTTVAVGQALLAISFVAGLIYLIRQIDQTIRSKRTAWLEFIMCLLFIFAGFSIISFAFNLSGYSAEFEYSFNGDTVTTDYHLPPIAGPNEGELLTGDRMEPLFDAPGWMQGVDAAGKLNTLIWSVLTGVVLYGLARLIFRKRIAAAIQPFLKKANPDMVDEISYRAVAIGFPVFTLGGLIFAAIWAHYAWDRFWGWDPKEVWALVTWLFYAAFLHLRLSRGWHGENSAWLAVGGFAIIMFNLIAVNLVLAGLHSYA